MKEKKDINLNINKTNLEKKIHIKNINLKNNN
jgi:hypothetical protein